MDGRAAEVRASEREGPWELPGGWCWAPLGTVAPVNPATSFEGLDDSSEIPFIPMAAVAEETGEIDLSAVRSVRDVSKGYVRFMEGDVIFAKITPCMENGKVAPVIGLTGRYAAGSTEFHVFRPVAVNQRYLWYWLVSRSFRNRAQRNMSGSAGQVRVPVDYLREARFPLAPIAEQRRIVARIDTLFAEIAEGEAALAAARKDLDIFRLSLLKAAITGELTREWREANSISETGHDALARIKVEREGKISVKSRGRRVAGSQLVGTSVLTEIPKQWTWASLSDVSWSSCYGTSAKCSRETNGVPVLRIPNIRAGMIVTEDIKFAASDLGLAAADYLSPGDLLIIRTNGSDTLIGRAGVVFAKFEQPAYFASYLIRFRLLGDEILWQWISFYFESLIVRQWMISQIASSAGQYNVSQSNLAALAIPIPPLEEAAEIVRLISGVLSDVADTLTILDAEAADASRLKQSILKAAFEGRLVPQDPADEPASALLERLAGSPPVGVSRSRGRPRKSAV